MEVPRTLAEPNTQNDLDQLDSIEEANLPSKEELHPNPEIACIYEKLLGYNATIAKLKDQVQTLETKFENHIHANASEQIVVGQLTVPAIMNGLTGCMTIPKQDCKRSYTAGPIYNEPE